MYICFCWLEYVFVNMFISLLYSGFSYEIYIGG